MDDDNVPDGQQIYFQSGLLSNVDDEWNSYTLDEQITASEGFFLGVITPGLYTSVALDDGEDEPWVFQFGTQYSNENWQSGNNWTDIGTISSLFQKNMLIRAYGINMGPANENENTIISQELSGENNREFEAYNIYRFQSALINLPDEWDLIAAAVTDTFYTDISWASLPVNTYQFAITSVYTNGVESLPSYSPELDKTLVYNDPTNNLLPTSRLYRNYPNPFNPSTTISFELAADTSENTELIIYNLKGQKVRTLVSGHLTSGRHSAFWNGLNDAQKAVTSGIYLYKLQSGDYTATRKMILIK